MNADISAALSQIFFVLAIVAVVFAFFLALVGCADMMERPESKDRKEDWFRLFDVLVFRGAIWSVQTFKQNWKIRHQGRKMIIWSLICFGTFLFSLAVHTGLEIYRR